MQKITAIVPMKLHSERVPEKNLRLIMRNLFLLDYPRIGGLC